MPLSLTQAVALHRSGLLDQAELAYRNILDDAPEHAVTPRLFSVLLK